MEKPQVKPRCKLIGQNGNVFNLIALTKKALLEAGLKEQAGEVVQRALNAPSYGEVLNILSEYVDII